MTVFVLALGQSSSETLAFYILRAHRRVRETEIYITLYSPYLHTLLRMNVSMFQIPVKASNGAGFS